jgi:hypothetical protein
MCNRYSITKNQDAIRRLFKVQRDSAGNLPPMRVRPWSPSGETLLTPEGLE